MTSRPLYLPQWGHARWARIFSWQFGHSAICGIVSPSCARRVEVRRLEWRRLGFGIFCSCFPSSYLIPRPDFDFQTFQLAPAVIGQFGSAVAFALIPVLPAIRTDTTATFATNDLHG